MQKNTDSSKHIFSGFSAADNELIDRALAIIARIPDDPHYHRPKGIEVAAILRDYNVDLKTIVAAILSDPRLSQLNASTGYQGTVWRNGRGIGKRCQLAE